MIGLRTEPEATMGWRRGQAYSQDLRERVLACDGLSAAVETGLAMWLPAGRRRTRQASSMVMTMRCKRVWCSVRMRP